MSELLNHEELNQLFKPLFDVAMTVPRNVTEGSFFYQCLKQAHMWGHDAINAANYIKEQQSALEAKKAEILNSAKKEDNAQGLIATP